ncbi:formimidoylglutamase [uncultured Corynebacterium sp.]|uniref:formimidoylglutamase n=1 Tax=uncultured Corynebacterium sp. TaxID=159447 RepID=UPI0025E020F2|nr:formimidoylglutamase [uncultured Corynebacterium sp.]
MSNETNIFPSELPRSWAGRVDGNNPDHGLWYTTVEPLTTPGTAKRGVATLGFASDEGNLRNHGPVGVAQGPAAIRNALGWLAVHDGHSRYDAGDVVVNDHDLERGHDELSQAVEDIVRAGHLPIVLGGGHEAGFGSHRGVYRALRHSPAIINLDAHLDLRAADEPTNGTPFRQVAELVGEEFDYSVLGVSVPNNTAFLFKSAERLGVTVVTDDELTSFPPEQAAAMALQRIQHSEHIHLTVDIDVLAESIAPGTGSPAPVGVPLATIRAVCHALAATGKLKLVDVVEVNPALDINNRTARVAARLIHEIAEKHLETVA